jgi:hypothetical protein
MREWVLLKDLPNCDKGSIFYEFFNEKEKMMFARTVNANPSWSNCEFPISIIESRGDFFKLKKTKK